MSSEATPGVSDMDRTTTAEPLAALQNLRVRQTLKGCFQTLLGCDANEQFRLSALENPSVELFAANEDTSCIVRTCCQSNRPMTINLTQGGDKGPLMLQFERPFACPISCGKCCCLQEMHVHDAQHKNLGMVQEASCWWCVPRFNVVRPDGTQEFTVKPPVCCGGLCMDCCSEGCAGCLKCRVPVNIYAGQDTDAAHVGQITKVWAGLGAELLGAHTFDVTMPAGATPVSKARLLAATFLLNTTLFAPEDQDDAANLA